MFDKNSMAIRAIERLRILLIEDQRWLASDPTSKALTQRYLDVISEDWDTKVIEDSDALRRRLDLEPLKKSIPSITETSLHATWSYAHDNPQLCSEGYNKQAFQHVQWWIDTYTKSK